MVFIFVLWKKNVKFRKYVFYLLRRGDVFKRVFFLEWRCYYII